MKRGLRVSQRQMLQHTLFCRGVCLCGSCVCLCGTIGKCSACPWDSGDPPPSLPLHYSALRGSRPYRLAVCPLASSLCLPTWLAFSSGNKGGVQFWAVPGSNYPTPTPFPFPGVTPLACLRQTPSLVLRGPFPQFQGEERLRSSVGTPFFSPTGSHSCPQ